jgi:hypothetical protein
MKTLFISTVCFISVVHSQILPPAQSIQWAVQTSQQERTFLIIQKNIQSCGGYIYEQNSDGATFRLPEHLSKSCLNTLEPQIVVSQKSIDKKELQKCYLEKKSLLKSKESLLKDYFALLSTSNSRTYVSVSQSLQDLLYQIEEIKSALNHLEEESKWVSLLVEWRQNTSPMQKSSEKSPFPWIRKLNPQNLLAEF